MLPRDPALRKARLKLHHREKFGHLNNKVLKHKAVSDATVIRYLKLLHRFDEFVRMNFAEESAGLDPDRLLDSKVAVYLDYLFWEGEASHTASATFAALGWKWPQISRRTKGGRLAEQVAKLPRGVAHSAKMAWNNFAATLRPR